MHRVRDNLSYILRHKLHVLAACLRLGHGRGLAMRAALLWRGLCHDLSKFTPTEFAAYGAHFHTARPVHECATSFYQPTGAARTFDEAWIHHLHRNDHHWQFWTLTEAETGSVCCIRMPEACALEMVADWWGAYRARAPRGIPVGLWFRENEWRIRLHPGTRALVEDLLDQVDGWTIPAPTRASILRSTAAAKDGPQRSAASQSGKGDR